MVANPSLDSSSISSQSTIDEAGASLAAQQILDEEDISEEMLNLLKSEVLINTSP